MSAPFAGGMPAARIDIQIGRVELVATQRTDVDVRVSPSNPDRSGDRSAAAATKVERIGGTVRVSGPTRWNLFGPGDSIDVVVEVPAASAVTVHVRYGSAYLSGPLGAVRLEADYGEAVVDDAARLELRGGHGDVRVAHVSGDAEVTVKSGTARIGIIGGALRAKGADAAVTIDRVAGPAEISTSSGAVDIGRLGGDVTIRSAYGAVQVRELVRGAAQFDGGYGNMRIGVRRGTAVWFDASAQYGTVRTDLAADAGPAGGEETLELRVRTGYGSITIHRSDTYAPGVDEGSERGAS